MGEAEDWATAVHAAMVLAADRTNAVLCDASRLVEQVTGQLMLCGAPKEVFSQDLPQYQPNSRERDLAPIDILYGAYSAETLVARTFIRRIELDADRYGSRADDLMNVVRIHEYAHAVVHLGIDQQDTKDCLSRFGPEGITDWDSFRVERQQAYRNLEPEVHEFLAQAITWVSVCKRCAEIGSDSLLETFVGLEQYQPAEYILPMGAKAAALFADWPLMLKAVREEDWFKRSPSVRLREGLAALLVRTARPTCLNEIPVDERLGAFSKELQAKLAEADLISTTGSSKGRHLEILVARKGHVELRMYKETGHARPHFHIEYKQEYAASYALDSFELLAGYMLRKYAQEVLNLAKAQQGHLLELWASTNGAAKCITPAD